MTPTVILVVLALLALAAVGGGMASTPRRSIVPAVGAALSVGIELPLCPLCDPHSPGVCPDCGAPCEGCAR